MTGYVLIVDDEPEITKLFEITLRKIGIKTKVANDGAEALRQIKRGRPDLVVLDLMMPGVSGFEVLKRLRRQPSTADLPVIVVSSYTNIPQARNLPVTRVMPKGSFGTPEIREAVASVLGL